MFKLQEAESEASEADFDDKEEACLLIHTHSFHENPIKDFKKRE